MGGVGRYPIAMAVVFAEGSPEPATHETCSLLL